MPKTRRLMKVVIDDKQYTFQQLHQMTGIKEATLKNRYYQGMEGEELIKPLGNQCRLVRLEPHGKKYTFQKLSRKYHIKIVTLNYRYRQGYRGEDLVRPVQTKYASNVIYN